ncbi:MAG: PAS domain S-box protein [Flavobacteriales bacterium]|nr:PAS domain S-box protein [Flavobacteriales bacterium]
MASDPVQEGPEQGSMEHHEIAQAYLDLKRQYDDLVGRNLAGVFRTTLDGRFLECNDSMARIMGYAGRDELMKLPAHVLYYDDVAREEFLEQLNREKKLVNFEITLRHKNGRAVHVLENVFLDEPDGRQPSIQGTLMDVSQFRQAELEQAHLTNSYRSLVEHIRDGLLVLVEGRFSYANPAVVDWVGSQPLGKTLDAVIHPADIPHLQQVIDTVLAGGEVQPHTARTIKDQEVVVFAALTVEGGQQAVQLTLQDQSYQKSVLQERLRVQLAEEVNEVLREEIAEHRRTQEALRRSKQFARSLVDSSLDMIIAADPEGWITEYNPAASLRFGWEVEEVMGKNTEILYANKEQFHMVKEELRKHGVFSGEIQNITRNGEVFTTYLAASRLIDESGNTIGAMGVSRDITRMKQDQEALKASEERYRDLFENATDLIQSVDSDGRFQYVNNAWYNTLGYSPRELRGLRLMDIIHPDHRDECLNKFKSLIDNRTATPIETIFVAKDGSEVLVEGSSNVRMQEGKAVATRSIFRDVTSVQKAKQRVQEHEAKLKALFQTSEHMFWTVDPNIKLTSYNQGYASMMQRLYGKVPDVDRDPKSPRKLFASEDYHAFWEEKYKVALGGTPVHFETSPLDKGGNRLYNAIFLSPVFGPDGEVTEVFGVGHEITEQKAAESIAEERNARLQAIFQSAANMMIWTLDHDLRITSCNRHFQQLTKAHFGIQPEVGDEFLSEHSSKAAGMRNDRYLERYKAALRGKPQQFEAELLDVSGKTLWVENFLNPIVVDGVVQEISCLAYDNTDRKTAQMEILRNLQEKEVLLKEVHHRVKNNLQIVSSIFNLQTAHVGEDERVLGLLRDSRDRIRSMAYIHESLYQHKDFSSIDLAGYIDGLSRSLMMSYSLSGKVELHTELEPVELVLDQAIPCGLILNELISNTLKHAFPGQLPGNIRLGLSCSGDLVRISIRDNGPGFPKGLDPNKDGNLGLELVRTLVEQLDGTLEFLPAKGVAVLFTFERTK